MELTVKQREILKCFENSVRDITEPDTDVYLLLRFLKARNFDKDNAEIMLRKCMKWRKQYRMQNFLDHYKIPEVLKEYHPGGMIGYDKEGCPVWIMNSLGLDIKGLLESCRPSDFVRFQVYRLECTMKYFKEQSERLNRRIDKTIGIFDFDHIVMREVLKKPIIEVVIQSLKILQANYPEILKKGYAINVPPLFSALWSIVKPILGEETTKKCEIYGRDGWKEALIKDIDASVLPVHWGGTRVDPVTGDPRCPSLINLAGVVPDCYYFNNKKRLRDEPDADFIIVPKKNYVDLCVSVDITGSIIEWQVETEQNELAIGLYYQKSYNVDEIIELAPCMRVETNKDAERGTYKCDEPGKYFVRLDNTFSWFTAKKVAYIIRAYPPSNVISDVNE